MNMNFDALIEAIQDEIQLCHGNEQTELAVEPEQSDYVNETREELFANALVSLIDAIIEDREHYADEYWGA